MRRAEIIERLEKLTGPDREVDELIACATGRTMPLSQALNIAPDDGCWVRRVGDQLHEIGHPRLSGMTTSDFYLPRHTASLDAAVALVEKMRPGWAWSASDGDDHGPNAFVHKRDDKEPVGALAATPAIALLLALFRSLPDTEER